MILDRLSNPNKRSKRIGRGASSGVGKTCGRGNKGYSSRSGSNSRIGYEGGQMRLFMKLPQRGFTRGRWEKTVDAVNLSWIERYFSDGELVTRETLRAKGLITNNCHAVKILGNGELTKKLAGFEVDAVSASAKQKIENAGIPLTVRA
ncbi:MAG: 50S ribosomal protein L15 [Verrucomicrobia bacterium]|nr:50S ribosomal protein L15 [Verrucomicrobiota bacterium]